MQWKGVGGREEEAKSKRLLLAEQTPDPDPSLLLIPNCDRLRGMLNSQAQLEGNGVADFGYELGVV
jgi:hypothetical protein